MRLHALLAARADAPRIRLTRWQLEVPRALLGDAGAFLAEGVPVTLALHAGEVLTATLPETVEAVVAQCGASMKARRAAACVIARCGER